jgi:hypothetical protein
MITSTRELSKLLEGTPLAGLELLDLPILDTDERALLVQLEPTAVLESSTRTCRGTSSRCSAR